MKNHHCLSKTISFASITAPNDSRSYAIFKDQIKDHNATHVYDAPLIRLISAALRVFYTVQTPTDEEFGAKLADGNWTGIIGMLKRSEVDLAVGGIDLTDDRREAVAFSYPHLFSEVTFMTDNPEPLSTSLRLDSDGGTKTH